MSRSIRPARICPEPGCPEFEPCVKHPKVEQPDTRANSAQRGYDGRWRKYSEDYRRRHPHCAECLRQGRQSPAAVVDHIQPITGPTDPRFWDRSNHEGKCLSCHAIKTQQEGRTQGTGPAKPPPAPQRWVIA